MHAERATKDHAATTAKMFGKDHSVTKDAVARAIETGKLSSDIAAHGKAYALKQAKGREYTRQDIYQINRAEKRGDLSPQQADEARDERGRWTKS